MQMEEDFVTEAASLQRVLFARAVGLSRSPEDARDLVQDTFERALSRRRQFQPGSDVRGWLLRIMHNLFIDRWRRKGREPFEHGLEYRDVPAPEVEPRPVWEEVDGERVRAALQALEPLFRQILEQRLVDQRSYREIGAALGIPTNTVGTRLRRARHKLRNVLAAAAPAA
jgi:RNA polymerase sigma-70 factor (ECF subfamily)